MKISKILVEVLDMSDSPHNKKKTVKPHPMISNTIFPVKICLIIVVIWRYILFFGLSVSRSFTQCVYLTVCPIIISVSVNAQRHELFFMIGTSSIRKYTFFYYRSFWS